MRLKEARVLLTSEENVVLFVECHKVKMKINFNVASLSAFFS
jgi:hypothetical protein